MNKEQQEILDLAKFMHIEYENYAKDVGWKTQKKCKVLFEQLPEKNRKVMLYVAEKVLEYINP